MCKLAALVLEVDVERFRANPLGHARVSFEAIQRFTERLRQTYQAALGKRCCRQFGEVFFRDLRCGKAFFNALCTGMGKGKALTLEQWVAKGHDEGTTVLLWPSDKELVEWIRQKLGLSH